MIKFIKKIGIIIFIQIRKLILALKRKKDMREIMTVYYIEAKTANLTGKKVAWITSGGPVEPLIAMDVIPVYPENYGAMIGASKMGVPLCEKAEEMGYSRDLCSYARADIACSVVKGGPVPGGLPKPDMLVACNNICGTVMKWYEVQARYYNAPLFIFDTPLCHTEYTDEAKKYVKNQIVEYIDFIENITGKKHDPARMEEVGRLSVEGQRLWQAILDTSINRPSPINAFECFFHLALIVTLRGTKIANNYYKYLLKTLNDKVAKGIGVIPNEKYRLLWDNLPVWYHLKWLSIKFAKHDASLVADTYTSAWSHSLKYIDEANFLDSMAEAYSRIYLNIGVDKMAETVIEMIDIYSIDGFVVHSNRSCKPYSFGQYEIMKKVQEAKGIPCLMIEADMLDARAFSESQIETRIDAFMEIIKQRKG